MDQSIGQGLFGATRLRSRKKEQEPVLVRSRHLERIYCRSLADLILYATAINLAHRARLSLKAMFSFGHFEFNGLAGLDRRDLCRTWACPDARRDGEARGIGSRHLDIPASWGWPLEAAEPNRNTFCWTEASLHFAIEYIVLSGSVLCPILYLFPCSEPSPSSLSSLLFLHLCTPARRVPTSYCFNGPALTRLNRICIAKPQLRPSAY